MDRAIYDLSRAPNFYEIDPRITRKIDSTFSGLRFKIEIAHRSVFCTAFKDRKRQSNVVLQALHLATWHRLKLKWCPFEKSPSGFLTFLNFVDSSSRL